MPYQFSATDLVAGGTAARSAHTRFRGYLQPYTAGITYSVTPGQQLPDGMTLDPDGTLSGTPTTVGSSTFTIDVDDGTETDTSDPITVQIDPSPHELEITRFRLVGPDAEQDWFADIYNTTTITVSLAGWKLGMTVPGTNPGTTTITPIYLGTGTIAPHGTMTVGGEWMSVPGAVVNVIGPYASTLPGGFQIVAPDGTVTDRAGEKGAPASVIASTGVDSPTGDDITAQSAFTRISTPSGPKNTGNNSVDFAYVSASPTIASPLRSLRRIRTSRGIDVRWAVISNRGIVGFRLSAGQTALTRRVIPVHHSRVYTVRTRYSGRAPITLHILFSNGAEWAGGT